MKNTWILIAIAVVLFLLYRRQRKNAQANGNAMPQLGTNVIDANGTSTNLGSLGIPLSNSGAPHIYTPGGSMVAVDAYTGSDDSSTSVVYSYNNTVIVEQGVSSAITI